MSKVLREERARLAASLGSFVVRRTDPTFHPMGSNEPYNDAGDRPLTAVFHGCYSFAREIHLTALLIDKGVPEVPTTDIRRYLAQRTEIVRAAWTLLHERARPEPAGAAILAEVEGILERLS